MTVSGCTLRFYVVYCGLFYVLAFVVKYYTLPIIVFIVFYVQVCVGQQHCSERREEAIKFKVNQGFYVLSCHQIINKYGVNS